MSNGTVVCPLLFTPRRPEIVRSQDHQRPAKAGTRTKRRGLPLSYDFERRRVFFRRIQDRVGPVGKRQGLTLWFSCDPVVFLWAKGKA